MNIKKLTGRVLLLIILGLTIDALLIWWGYSFIKAHPKLTVAIVASVVSIFIVVIIYYKIKIQREIKNDRNKTVPGNKGL